MADHDNGMPTVFELMLEELEAEIDLMSRAGVRAFEARDPERAHAAAGEVEWLTTFRAKVADLRAEWALHHPAQETVSDTVFGQKRCLTPFLDEEPEPTHRRNLGRLARGARTPEEAYYPHVLRALVELGGSADLGDVLDRVGRTMAGELRAVDHQPLNSDPDTPRWRNSAQWARSELVKRGLMRDDSPRRTWAISDAGREWLAKRGD